MARLRAPCRLSGFRRPATLPSTYWHNIHRGPRQADEDPEKRTSIVENCPSTLYPTWGVVTYNARPLFCYISASNCSSSGGDSLESKFSLQWIVFPLLTHSLCRSESCGLSVDPSLFAVSWQSLPRCFHRI
jgi:hypothetical protein